MKAGLRRGSLELEDEEDGGLDFEEVEVGEVERPKRDLKIPLL